MAFQSFMVRWSRSSSRYHLPYLGSLFQFSTQSNTLNCNPSVEEINVQSNLSERYVLNELSDLLSVSSNLPNPPPFKQSPLSKHVESRDVVDCFLLPEEKLRGVFLQKLKGKFAIESALTNACVDLNLNNVSKVLNRGNLSAKSMIVFFNWAIKQPMISKDIQTYNILIRALGRRNYVDSIVKILYEMRADSVSLNVETLSIVFDSFVKACRVCKVVQMFGNSEEFGFEWSTKSLNVLLQCLCKRSHVGTANSYFNSVKGRIPFDRETYNILIGGWSKSGRVGEMERVLEVMVEDGFSPDCLTYSYLIEGLGRSGRIQDAVKIFDSMETKGCVPDAAVYNAVISNFVSVRELDECMKYYRCLLGSNCEPNADTYDKLISGLIKTRKVADALEVFDEMLARGIVPATGTVTSFIEPLCSFGPPHAAMMIYKKAKRVGCKFSSSAYKQLLMRLARFGKCGMMLKVWNEMEEDGWCCDMEVYEYVINGLCNIGQLENAALAMEEAICKGFCPSRLIYSKLSNKLLESGKVERAYKLFLRNREARRAENARKFWRANGWHF